MDVLDRRRLNRATLERQLLLERQNVSPLKVIELLVGLNAQDPDPPYIGLWSRIAPFSLDDLTRLLVDRTVVRATLLRGTQHIVAAADHPWLRELLGPKLERIQRSAFTSTRGLDIEQLRAEGRAELGAVDSMTRAELGRALAARFPTADPAELGRSIQYLLPVVHPPPDSTWGRRGPTPFVLAERWLGAASPPADGAAMARRLVRRYLAAFGPASVKDVQAWSGLTRLRAVVEELRPRLRTFTDENGVELFDLPDRTLPDRDVPAPVRFLAALDNVLLGHHDRSRIVTDEQRRHVFLEAAVTVDGFVRGLWRIRRQETTATVVVRLFAPLSATERDAVVAEGRLLLAAAAPEHEPDVQFLPLEAPWPAGTPWDCSGMRAGRAARVDD